MPEIAVSHSLPLLRGWAPSRPVAISFSQTSAASWLQRPLA